VDTTTTEQVTSADGTTIYCEVTGAGPGVVIVCGGLLAGHHYQKLAASLAGDFTVYAMDRRGRGGSGPQGDGYTMDKECEDLVAVLKHTGAAYVFGHSYGGLVALHTAMRHPVEKLAVFEPAVSIDGSWPDGFLPAFRRALSEGRDARAMALVVKALQLNGSASRLPGSVLTALIAAMFASSSGREARQILPTVASEQSETIRLDSAANAYAEITAPVLLLQGADSPTYLHQAAAALDRAMPRAQLRTMTGVLHDGPQRVPERFAAELRGFFSPAASV
jgi:pimeloyl-ACP methyl ester carboxylesterase